MDAEAARVLAPLVWEEQNGSDKFEEFCDSVIAEMEKHPIRKTNTASWAPCD